MKKQKPSRYLYLVILFLSFPYSSYGEEDKDASKSVDVSVSIGSSSSDLKKPAYVYDPNALIFLAKIDNNIYEELIDFIEKLKPGKKKYNATKHFIQDYEDSMLPKYGAVKIALPNPIKNPITCYRLIRRFMVQLPKLVGVLNQKKDRDILDQIIETSYGIKFPNNTDYRDSVMAILRVQEYSSLSPSKIANGTLGTFKTSTGLNAVHAYEIGTKAKAKRKLAVALEWFEVALSIVQDDVPFVSKIVKVCQQIVNAHDRDWPKLNKKGKNCFTQPIADKYGGHMPRRTKTFDVEKRNAIPYRLNSTKRFNKKANFINICSGKNLQTEEEKMYLNCWFDTDASPYYLISPLKMEVLYADPPLIQIHNFISLPHAKEIISKGNPQLQTASTGNSKKVKELDKKINKVLTSFELDRMSSETWIEEREMPVLQRLSKTIELLTGLKTTETPSAAEEQFQIAAYRGSHYYNLHLDMATKDVTRPVGEEGFATFMIFLSDVDVGGRTAFPVLGVGVKPTAGSALFWYNLDANGEPDTRLIHGDCPVLHGMKWVATKWIQAD